jgi:putative AbiEi antitoxin of type IV toxin-antitoxin system
VAEDEVVTLQQALAAGLSRQDVRRNVDAGRWQRVGRTVYRTNSTNGDAATIRLAYIRATLLSLGHDAVAVYDTAAELHGIAGLSSDTIVHVGVPGRAARKRADERVRVHQLILPNRSITAVSGIAVTTPLWTAAQTICRVGRYAAVSVLDSALNKGLVTPDEFESIPGLIVGCRGARAARAFALEADARAQSPLETRMRLRCVDGDVPPDDLQHPIRDADGFVQAVADAAWPAARVAAEADGREPHATPEALYQDRRRQNRMMIAGWTVLRFTWADTLRPDYIPETVRQALRRGGRRRSV